LLSNAYYHSQLTWKLNSHIHHLHQVKEAYTWEKSLYGKATVNLKLGIHNFIHVLLLIAVFCHMVVSESHQS
jgi:hypothetical protein